MGGASGQPAGDGLAAGGVGIEELGEEDPAGDQRGEEAVAEGDGLVAEGRWGQVCGEQWAEGQSGGVGEAWAEWCDGAGTAWEESRSPDGLLAVEDG